LVTVDLEDQSLDKQTEALDVAMRLGCHSERKRRISAFRTASFRDAEVFRCAQHDTDGVSPPSSRRGDSLSATRF
jgi:hypothetical protein